jgi:hypothetical protein
VLITDRPYTEGKEPIGGCLMVTASDLDAALVSTRKLVAVLGNGLDSLPVEVRPFRGEPDGS